ncbi:MAG: hypothetical protein P4L26_12705 [Terracidiphilus sp.]|nr:hypothetical protein [Terracidiphilus sp.]
MERKANRVYGGQVAPNHVGEQLFCRIDLICQVEPSAESGVQSVHRFIEQQSSIPASLRRLELRSKQATHNLLHKNAAGIIRSRTADEGRKTLKFIRARRISGSQGIQAIPKRILRFGAAGSGPRRNGWKRLPVDLQNSQHALEDLSIRQDGTIGEGAVDVGVLSERLDFSCIL